MDDPMGDRVQVNSRNLVAEPFEQNADRSPVVRERGALRHGAGATGLNEREIPVCPDAGERTDEEPSLSFPHLVHCELEAGGANVESEYPTRRRGCHAVTRPPDA